MTICTITKDNKDTEGKITLPSSKSISNRVLLINALSNSFAPIGNLSDCEDTRSMLRVLNSNTNKFDVGDSGTSMRFLTAFLSKIVGKWEITGSERMQQRPIGELAEALNSLGAQIEYLGKEGYPPLQIYGSNLTGKEVTMQGNTSSQFISALMLIAPYLPEGLTINTTGKVVSRSYIHLTAAVMKDFGAKVSVKDNSVTVQAGGYESKAYTVESDWTAASYHYAVCALSDNGKIKLEGLKKNSPQGDAKQTDLWSKLGVITSFSKRGMFIQSGGERVKRLDADFTDMPDLVQTFAVACTALNIPFCFSGIHTLKIKETDRIHALIEELGKLGYIVRENEKGELVWDGKICKTDSADKDITATASSSSDSNSISTYGDHRMAMAFAPLALVRGSISIESPEVVNKSYPRYWEDLKRLGFKTENK